MQGLLQLLFLLASNAFLARALPLVERGFSVSSGVSSSVSASVSASVSSSFTLDGWNDLCGSCFSSDLYFSNLCFELGSVGWNFALSESADICVQQQVADQMIFLAKSSSISESESSALIAYAVGFNELPHSVSSVVVGRHVSACTIAPVNPELSGSIGSISSGSISSGSSSSGSISNGPISIPSGSSSSSSIPSSGSSSVIPDSSSTDFNSTDVSGNSTLTGSDSSNSTDLSGSNSTDTSNSTLTGTDSSNSTDTSTDTSSTDLSTDSTDTSTATDSSIVTATATATDSSVATTTDSATAATATSSQTFDGNIHDPAGRRRSFKRRL